MIGFEEGRVRSEEKRKRGWGGVKDSLVSFVFFFLVFCCC